MNAGQVLAASRAYHAQAAARHAAHRRPERFAAGFFTNGESDDGGLPLLEESRPSWARSAATMPSSSVKRASRAVFSARRATFSASLAADRRRKRRHPQLAPSWERALRTKHRRCPLCAEPLLHVEDPPDSCTQWETWYRGIRRALAHQAITQTSSGPTIHRLVHTDCARRHPGVRSHDPDQRMHDA